MADCTRHAGLCGIILSTRSCILLEESVGIQKGKLLLIIMNCPMTWLLKGNILLKLDGFRMVGGQELYSEKPPVKEKDEITAIPYYAWTNRGENQMRVWVQEE